MRCALTVPHRKSRIKIEVAEQNLELDANFKRLVEELGQAINDSLSESEAISEVMARIRGAGYDVFLLLEVTIGFNKRGEADGTGRARSERKEPRRAHFQLTKQDTQFLRALKITIDDEAV
jgi:hypothetical protein